MTIAELLNQRLYNQHLAGNPLSGPADMVESLVAVQAQDYPGAKWSLAMRLDGLKEEDIDEAFNKGEILRTHVLRPTWHFVSPRDIRWLLKLTSPHIHALSDYYYRQSGLDSKTFAQCNKIIEKELRDNNYKTRDELKITLHNAGIKTDTLRLAYILMCAELEGLICSGPRKGKQFTYALMDDRAPALKTYHREEYLALLSERYIKSHGPATVHDFAKWSGLKIGEAKTGMELVKSKFYCETIEGREYWFSALTEIPENTAKVYLLPTYDEFVIGYKHTGLFFDNGKSWKLNFDSTIMQNGIIKGSWRRTLQKNTVTIEIKLVKPVTKAFNSKLLKEAKQYGEFLGLKAEVKFL